jgi:polar amino acid transport system substrate-binding protein
MRIMNPTRRFLRVAALSVIAIAMTAASASAESTLERAREQGFIRIGFANEAPYGYATANGKLTGEAPEIAKVILERLGIPEVDGVLTEFGSLIPGLKAGRFDIIAAGMYILPKRCEQVDFSNPTYSIGEGFVVAKGNPKNLHSYADVKDNPDVKLGLMAGAVESDYARATGIPESQWEIFPDGPSAVAGVAAGRVDAYAGTSLTVADLSGKAGNRVEVAKPFEDPMVKGKSVRGYGAFAFRKDDDELRQAFNRELAKFIGSEEHRKLVRPFGFTETELPGDKTAEDLCEGKM